MLPTLSQTGKYKRQIIEFKGYNHNSSIDDGEFFDMRNLTSSYYPALSPRKPRGTVREETIANPYGLFAKNKLAYVDSSVFFYDNFPRGTVWDGEKQFVSMGAYILIFPDKAYYNTETEEYGFLQRTYVASGNVTYLPCLIDGTPSTDGLYARITSGGITEGFKQYDGVTISQSSVTSLNKTAIIQAVGTGEAGPYIVIPGKITASSQSGGILIERTVPDMDFLTEHENRVWGCSSEKHEIYACKLGDPFNWNCFEGISTDSYAATVGSDGDFTGAITYAGYVLFFKEDCVHKIYGSKPSNFQIFENDVRGVKKGCEKSLCIVNEILLYLSQSGVVAYEGSTPSIVSYQFGDKAYSGAAAGGIGDKYYISMTDGTLWYLFVYDVRLNMWHLEDNTHALYFAYLDNALYYIDSDKKIKTVSGNDDEIIPWYGQFSDMPEKSHNKKYVSKLSFILELENGSIFDIEIMYENTGVWEKLASVTGKIKKSINVSVPVKRADFYTVKLSGVGGFKLYSMMKTLSEGSDL